MSAKLSNYIRRYLPAGLSTALFVFTFLLVFYYIIIPSRTEFHSDTTDTIMWAYASYESGHLFSPTFTYAALLPFGVNLLMLPFFRFFGLSMTTHCIGMVLFLCLFSLMLWLMLAEAGWNKTARMRGITVILLMTLSSAKFREMFWGHAIYYSLGVFFLVVAAWLYLFYQNHRKLLAIVFLMVFIVLASTDGISALTLFSFPFLAAIFVVFVLDPDIGQADLRTNLKKLLLFFCLALCVIAGLKLKQILAGGILAGYETAYSNYSSISEWMAHLLNLPIAWIRNLGVTDMKDQPMMGAASARMLIRLLAGIMLAVMPVIASCFYPVMAREKKGQAVCLWIWIHWGAVVLLLLGYVCGLLSAADWRLLPIQMTAMLVTLLFLHWLIWQRRYAGRVCLLLFAPLGILCLMNISQTFAVSPDYHKANDIYQIAEALEEENLHYGYATFWRANALTVISDDRIRSCSINIHENGIEKYLYQNDWQWFEDQEGQPDYFLLTDQGEWETLLKANPEFMDQVIHEIGFQTSSGGNYHVMVFDHNLF